ncbi:IS1595 family transposase [Myxococcota bacterium]|nr:IS1595 family transposase [Myxococcota bacterium]
MNATDTTPSPFASLTLRQISAMTEDEARAVIEQMVWPNGPVCPHCESEHTGVIKANPEKRVRAGLHQCKHKGCRKQFTVTVGTIMEKSKIPLKTWLMAVQIMCASKKGVSALQLHRMLGFGSYETAWFMGHRIRHAMANGGLGAKFTGTVEADETYVGGKPRYKGESKTGRGTNKIPVAGLVERGGEVRAKVVANVTGATLKGFIRENVMPTAVLMTDENTSYRGIDKTHPFHETVTHSKGEYVRKGDKNVHSNTIESFWSLVKRSIMGAWHHVSPEHLNRYLGERAFTWNTRKLTDGERVEDFFARVTGARLTYLQGV